MRHLHLFTLMASISLAAAACADGPEEPTSSELISRAQALLPSTGDAERRIPGFGGFFLDEDGLPAVYMMPEASQAAAEVVFADYLAELGLPESEVRVLDGRYEWRSLNAWQTSATAEALAVEGSVFVDSDETSNRVRIGVEDSTAEAKVLAALAKAGVPEEAVYIDQVEPIYQVASLQNVVDRPVRAGVQINFPGFLCSVGFNANSGGQRSFITASHCTTRQGGVESTPYFQPLQSVNGTQIGTEVSDPNYTTGGGCPLFRRCRRSDAARVVYANGANQALGSIARTSGPNNGSLEIVGSLRITADDTNNAVAVNSTVQKVGRTTGWTSGRLSSKCVNVNVGGTNITQFCQNVVVAGVGGGDSGSDAFQVISGNDVRLEGILWGGGGGTFVYSPLQNVIQELGALTTH
jgi:hypothetical protein